VGILPEFFSDETRFGHVDMVRAIRSPGSTLKPFYTPLPLKTGLYIPKAFLLTLRFHSKDTILKISPAIFQGL